MSRLVLTWPWTLQLGFIPESVQLLSGCVLLLLFTTEVGVLNYCFIPSIQLIQYFQSFMSQCFLQQKSHNIFNCSRFKAFFNKRRTIFSIVHVSKLSSTKVAHYFQLFAFQSFFFSLTGTRNTTLQKFFIYFTSFCNSNIKTIRNLSLL